MVTRAACPPFFTATQRAVQLPELQRGAGFLVLPPAVQDLPKQVQCPHRKNKSTFTTANTQLGSGTIVLHFVQTESQPRQAQKRGK